MRIRRKRMPWGKAVVFVDNKKIMVRDMHIDAFAKVTLSGCRPVEEGMRRSITVFDGEAVVTIEGKPGIVKRGDAYRIKQEVDMEIMATENGCKMVEVVTRMGD